MLKKLIVGAAAVAAGLVPFSGTAAADAKHPADGKHPVLEGNGTGIESNRDDVSLVDVENVDALHNVNVVAGVCDNNVNVLGVQVVVEDTLNGVQIPVLSPGQNQNAATTADNCAVGMNSDGGSVQDNN